MITKLLSALLLCSALHANEMAAAPKGKVSDEMGCKARTSRGCPNGRGFYLMADFLYWRAENHGFSYAFNRKDDFVNNGSVVRINPDWDPAFRLGFGINSNYDGWDALVNWTWYQNHPTETRTRTDIVGIVSNQGFYPQWPVADSTLGPYRDVSASWYLRYNSLDTELGRGYYITKQVSLRPHIGARAAWIDQQFKNRFTNLLGSVAPAEASFSGKNNYWGIGPRAGMHGEWHMGRGFSLLGKMAAALLYGQARTRNSTESLVLPATEYTVTQQYTDNFYQLVPNLQLLLGFQWGTCFHKDKYYFGFNVSWEANYWWNQFNVPVGLGGYISPMPTVGNQSLTMEGLTLNFEFDI